MRQAELQRAQTTRCHLCLQPDHRAPALAELQPEHEGHMEQGDELQHKQSLRDEVLRKVGRNVVIFQQIEQLLKHLITHQRADGTAADLVERLQRRATAVNKHTLGMLVGKYTNGYLADAEETSQAPVKIADGWVSVTDTTRGSEEFYEAQRANMKLLTDERNELVHHFLPRWESDSLERLTAAATYLDAQREKVLPMFEHLKNVAIGMQKARQTLATIVAFPEWEHQFELLWLQQSPLISLLQDVATQEARADGWTYLSRAGDEAKLRESDAMEHMQERYGHSTLKQLLLASELFEIREEALPNGGSRTLYRVRR